MRNNVDEEKNYLRYFLARKVKNCHQNCDKQRKQSNSMEKKKTADRQPFSQCNLSCGVLQTKCQTTFFLYTKRVQPIAPSQWQALVLANTFISGTTKTSTAQAKKEKKPTTHTQAVKSSLIKMSKGNSSIRRAHTHTHSQSKSVRPHADIQK